MHLRKNCARIKIKPAERLCVLCLARRLRIWMRAWQTREEGRESLAALQSAANTQAGRWKSSSRELFISRMMRGSKPSFLPSPPFCQWNDRRGVAVININWFIEMICLCLAVTAVVGIVLTLWPRLSLPITVMLRVFTQTLNWTELVHMSRMNHLPARAHNPLQPRWIIYTTKAT